MNLNEIASKTLHNGSLYRLETKKDMKVLKANEKAGISVRKESSIVGQFGVKFQNKKQYNAEYRANHTEEVPEWLKFHWVIENLVGQYDKSGKQFLRLNVVESHKPTSRFFKTENGVETEITKDEAKALCLASEFPTKPNDSGCYTIPLERIVAFAENH